MQKLLFWLLPSLLLPLGGCAMHHTVGDSDDSQLMARCHDPVSYLTLAAATPGNPAIKAIHDTCKIIDGRLFMIGGAGSKRYFKMDQGRNLKLTGNDRKTEVRVGIPHLRHPA